MHYENTGMDTVPVEVSEFFSLSELVADIRPLKRVFDEKAAEYDDVLLDWPAASERERSEYVATVLERLETTSRMREIAAAGLLYTMYGLKSVGGDAGEEDPVWGDVEPRIATMRQVTALLLAKDGFTVLMQALLATVPAQNVTFASPMTTTYMRLVLNLLYPIVLLQPSEDLRATLLSPMLGLTSPPPLLFFDLVSDHNKVPGCEYPVKKLLLLLWKSLLVVTAEPYEQEAEELLASVFKSGQAGERPIRVKATRGDLEYYQQTLVGSYAAMNEGRVPRGIREAEAMLRASVPRTARTKSDREPTEILFAHMAPHMHRYVVVALKILLASSPTVRNYTGTVILTGELDLDRRNKAIDSTAPDMFSAPAKRTLGEEERDNDRDRHKEIIVKSLAAILLLLLKKFRKNDARQFEYLAGLLTDSNCILLILKFINQELPAFFTRAPDADRFPQLLMMGTGGGTDAEETIAGRLCCSLLIPDSLVLAESDGNDANTGIDLSTIDPRNPTLPSGSTIPRVACMWRNVFSTIGLVRVLQKLTKGRRMRIKNMIQFKSHIILKRMLKVRLPLLNHYTLKLLKSQARYLGRKWIMGNMKIISSIYEDLWTEMRDTWLIMDSESDAEYAKADEVAMEKIDDYIQSHYLYDGGASDDPDRPKSVDELMNLVQLDSDFADYCEEWVRTDVLPKFLVPGAANGEPTAADLDAMDAL